MAVQILIGDVFDRMAGLPDNSIECCVSSFPYWGLRDYGIDGQIGLEPTLGEHIETAVRVCEEIKRVLKPDGTFWLNYGDCYATSANGRSAADTKALSDDDRTFRDKPFSTVGPINNSSHDGGIWKDGKHKDAFRNSAKYQEQKAVRPLSGFLKPKDLCMIPNRIAIALQDAGWWVRSEIIWAKPNPMPESVTDRPATAHDKIWLLTKSARYWYDAEAVREERTEGSRKRWDGETNRVVGRQANDSLVKSGAPFDQRSLGLDRNLRNVWSIPTQGFPEAHFATFPPKLIEPCIKAGCPEGGTVLDPFGGSGTTGLVADRLGRNAILIELNPEYAAIAERRLNKDAGMFAEVTAV